MRHAIGSTLLALALAGAAAGCGDGNSDGNGEDGASELLPAGLALTIYASLPAHGISAGAGDDAALGMRRALDEAGARAAGRRVRMVRLASTRPEDETWDPGTVKANAERAADDPTAIAYIGELDQGGSAVSLPVTNDVGMLQVSPADGLTSLTGIPIGRPRSGPERYYEKGRESFIRLVPADAAAARDIVSRIGGRRFAVVYGGGNADRELEAMVGTLATRRRMQPLSHAALGEEPEEVAELARELAAARLDAVILTATAGPASSALLDALAARLPDVPVHGGPQLAAAPPSGDVPRVADAVTGVLPIGDRPPAAHRLAAELRRSAGRAVGPHALLGYEAMRLTLEAIDAAGADRPAVIREALRSRSSGGVLGAYEVRPSGDVRGPGLIRMPLAGGR